MRKKNLVFFVVISFALAACSVSHNNYIKQSKITSLVNSMSADTKVINKKLSKLSVPFIENRGQAGDEVTYYANTFAGNVYVTAKGEIVYGLTRKEEKTFKSIAFRETLIGAKELSVTGENKSETNVNYFIGKQENWKSSIPTWESVNLGEIYNGIELNLKAYGKNVEKLFTVNKEGRVEDIKLNIEGSKGLKINNKGELEIETELGCIALTKPFAYQEIDGKREEIKCDYVIAREQSDRGNPSSYGFRVASYNKDYPLVIDPLLASTFIGGTSSEYIIAIAIDKTSGNIFVAGAAYSTDYPTTPGSYDTTHNGGSVSPPKGFDVVVSKFNSDLSSLLASTFIGGSGDEGFNHTKFQLGIAIDSYNNIFIAGQTSSLADYPTTTGAYKTSTTNTAYDGFVSKFNNDLDTLLASTFIDVTDNNSVAGCNAVAIDSSDNVYAAGETWQWGSGASTNMLVVKLNNNLTSLLSYRTWGFKTLSEYANSIAIDSTGNTFYAGKDEASPDVFNGTALVHSYDYNAIAINGLQNQDIRSIAIDSADNIFIAGNTEASDFTVTAGAYDTSYNGYYDAFITKIDNGLSNILASTYIGGSDIDEVFSLAIDSSGNVFVAGRTLSADYPTIPSSYDTSKNGSGYDAFVSKLDNNLTSLLASTFIGGNSNDCIYSIAVDSSDNIIAGGNTGSSDYPITPGAYDGSYKGGSGDAFVSKFDNNLTEGTGTPTAITLSSFNATQKGKKIVLKWKTETEVNNVGFNILRADSEYGEYAKINMKVIKARGKSTRGAKYKFKDKKAKGGNTYWYNLQDIDSETGTTEHGPVSVEVTMGKKKS